MKYWEEKGKHSAFFEKIWDDLVPVDGESEDPIAEAVRAFGRINYDMGNNGAGNLFEEVGGDRYCFYDEEENEIEYVPTEMFEDFLSTLEKWVPYDLILKLKHECELLSQFDDFDKIKVIDQVGDALGDRLIMEIRDKKLDHILT